ncbi:Cysteine-rich receptor-like protein kinase 34 [Cardamine amara subsp. amara]|uniref:Cysteine-rich receptor-like protein kinase 34 n=1 Tax=Cardamine amara subsp. amara TaxID=228776 RepID=A0ABD1A444_CARAN
MARIFEMDQTQAETTRIVGTYGYMSPEYAMKGPFSVKSNVYSFGVLVLEIITGKRNSSLDQDGNARNLVTYVWRLWREGPTSELVDPSIGENYDSNEATRCIHMALLCVQQDPADRPTLASIILMLTSNTITLPVPQQPGFFFQRRLDQDFVAEGLDSSHSTGRSAPYSVNDVWITDLEPR